MADDCVPLKKADISQKLKDSAQEIVNADKVERVTDGNASIFRIPDINPPGTVAFAEEAKQPDGSVRLKRNMCIRVY